MFPTNPTSVLSINGDRFVLFFHVQTSLTTYYVFCTQISYQLKLNHDHQQKVNRLWHLGKDFLELSAPLTESSEWVCVLYVFVSVCKI